MICFTSCELAASEANSAKGSNAVRTTHSKSSKRGRGEPVLNKRHRSPQSQFWLHPTIFDAARRQPQAPFMPSLCDNLHLTDAGTQQVSALRGIVLQKYENAG